MFSTRYLDQLPGFYSRVMPTPLSSPYWVGFNDALAGEIQLPVQPDDALMDVFSGRGLFQGHEPIAQKYAGHQFGGWNPDLGDGRGLLMGEWQDASGGVWELHLKGAGKTPYSRFGDGRAVLRSSIREFIGSEAVHALGIASTRALGVIGSTEEVVRETIEPGAALIRVTQSHVRFGHFEWLAFSNQREKLQQLIDYVLQHHYPQQNNAEGLFAEIVARTATMIAGWMAYGFVHGVMNTDNMSILGETFDYGPYAFMDKTQLNAVFNHSDDQGRYAFHQQPMIGFWNLQRLAQALAPVADQTRLADALKAYDAQYNEAFVTLMTARLGGDIQQPIDAADIIEWLQLLSAEKKDFHQPLRSLSKRNLSDWDSFGDEFIDRDRYLRWLARMKNQVISDDAERQAQMSSKNPAVVARTHHLQAVIDEAHKGNMAPVASLLKAVQNPFEETDENTPWQAVDKHERPVHLSCSS